MSSPAPRCRVLRVPLRVIERAYGRGNVDNAGDDMADALRQVSHSHRSRLTIDSAHPNPWYHCLVLEVEDLPDATFARLVELLTELGLAVETGNS